MNRRIFLKLLGSSLMLPSAALFGRIEKDSSVRKGMVVITVELTDITPYEQFKVDTGYRQTGWQNFFPTTWGRMANSDAYYCGDDKNITITFSDGDSIVVSPFMHWNDDFQEFDTINIVKDRDTIAGDFKG